MEKLFGARKDKLRKKRITKPKDKGKEYDFKANKFRYLNEFLYTKSSKEADEYFKANKNDFEQYHVGYRSQIQKWPVKPVLAVIDYIEKNEARFADK